MSQDDCFDLVKLRLCRDPLDNLVTCVNWRAKCNPNFDEVERLIEEADEADRIALEKILAEEQAGFDTDDNANGDQVETGPEDNGESGATEGAATQGGATQGGATPGGRQSWIKIHMWYALCFMTFVTLVFIFRFLREKKFSVTYST